MKYISLNLEELQQMENILQLAQKISEIYDKLSELEINNQKNTKQYNELIKLLNNTLKQEEKIYSSINLSNDSCLKYLELIASQTQMPIGDNKVTTTMKYMSNKAYRRVYLKLFALLESTEEFQKSIMPDPIADHFSQLDKKIKKEIIDSFNSSIKLNNSLNSDINNIFLSILEEIITSSKYKEYKNELIKAKYCIIYGHSNLEKMMIQSNFDVPEIVYTSSKITNDLLISSDAVYNLTKILQLRNKARIEIDTLLKIKDSEYQQKDINITAIIIQCYIRALLSLMNSNEVQTFNEEFHDKIDSKEYLKEHPTDRISEELIINCFKAFKKDKTRIRILSTQ